MDRMTAMEMLVTVVECGSFSAAARLLHIGQPSVSKTIAQLEERLEVRLLIRSTHGLALTEAGHAYYAHAKRAIEQADEADFAAKGAASRLAGRLRVSAAVTFARIHIIPKLPLFLQQNPELSIDIILDDGNVDLLERGQDARKGPGPQWPPLRSRGIGICSLISWIATTGKVRANSRNHMPNHPNDPARMPQSAQVGCMFPQTYGRKSLARLVAMIT